MDSLKIRKLWNQGKRWAYRTFCKSPLPNWRTRIIRETGFSFPIPKHPRGAQKKVPVNSTGLKFYKHGFFPQWTAWDINDPDYLYVNTKQFTAIIRYYLKLPGQDTATERLADSIAAGILTKHYSGRHKIKSLGTMEEITMVADPSQWFHPQEIQQIRNF